MDPEREILMSMDRSVLLALAAVFVGACGGGGGGDSSSGSNNPPPPPVSSGSITVDNGDDVARSVVTSAEFVKDFGLPAVAGPVPTPTGVDTQPANARSQFAQVIGNDMRRGITGMRTIAAEPEVFPCTLGGNIEVTATVATEGALTAGDIVSIVYNSCAETTGTTDGAVDMTVTDSTGEITAPPFSVGLDIVMTGVTLVQDTSTVSADGTFSAVLAAETTEDLSLDLSGPALTTDVRGDGTSLQDFAINESDDLAAGTYTRGYSGTVASDSLGSFDFDTPTSFSGTGGAAPTAGELVITADDGSTAHVTAVDGTNVTIAVDTDGDGADDDVIDTTWEDLTSGT
jgi:hypothetical protein